MPDRTSQSSLLSLLSFFLYFFHCILPIPYLFFQIFKFVVTFPKINPTHTLLGRRGHIDSMDSLGNLSLTEAVSETIPISQRESGRCLFSIAETSRLGIYF